MGRYPNDTGNNMQRRIEIIEKRIKALGLLVMLSGFAITVTDVYSYAVTGWPFHLKDDMFSRALVLAILIIGFSILGIGAWVASPEKTRELLRLLE